MFEQFYHLSANPFRLTPDPRFRYAHGSYALALDAAERAISLSEGFMVITGAPGTGKTTFVDDLGSRLRKQKIPVAKVSSTQVEAEDLLRLIAYGFGLDADRGGKAAVLSKLERFLRRQHQAGNTAKLIIDEAQDLNSQAMEELRLLTNLEADYQPILQIFLAGQEELIDTLMLPEFERMHQRIVAICELRPLDASQLRGYIAHRLMCVGWRGDPRISGDALRHIHRFTLGIPRRINVVMARMLMHGSVERSHVLDATDLYVVLEGLEQDHLVPSNRMDDPLGVTAPTAAPALPPLDAKTVAELENDVSEPLAMRVPYASEGFAHGLESWLTTRLAAAGFLAARVGRSLASPVAGWQGKVRTLLRGRATFDSVVRLKTLVRRPFEGLKGTLSSGESVAGSSYVAMGAVALVTLLAVYLTGRMGEPDADIRGGESHVLLSNADEVANWSASVLQAELSPNSASVPVKPAPDLVAGADKVAHAEARPGMLDSGSILPPQESPAVAAAEPGMNGENPELDMFALPEAHDSIIAAQPMVIGVPGQAGTLELSEQDEARPDLARSEVEFQTGLEDFSAGAEALDGPEVLLTNIDINSLPATSAGGSHKAFSGSEPLVLTALPQEVEFEVDEEITETTSESVKAVPEAVATESKHPEPPSGVDSKAIEIERWLTMGERAVLRERLTLPKGQSAYDYFSKVLVQDPGNRRAKQGMTSIVSVYADIAESKLAAKDLTTAQTMVERGLAVMADSERLLTLKGKIAAIRSLNQAKVEIAQRPPVQTQEVKPEPAPAAVKLPEVSPAVKGFGDDEHAWSWYFR